MKTVAILEVMWDWRAKTSSAGYAETAPRAYRINPDNFTGKRLYQFVGDDDLWVTNACPQLVSSASGRGTPDPKWLRENMERLAPMDLVLVCGKVAQATFMPGWVSCRIVELPHPAARTWTKRDLRLAAKFIQQGSHDIDLRFERGRLRAFPLIPF